MQFSSRVFAALLWCLAACASHASAVAEAFPGEQSEWSGCVRYDFEHAGRPAIVVAPKEPAEGRPWLWRGEFFGAFPSVDQALLKEGSSPISTAGTPSAARRR